MPDPSAVVAGLILTFGSADGSRMAMTVVLTSTAPADLQWGLQTRRSPAARRHRFAELPSPGPDGVDYVLRAGNQTIARRIAPASPERVVLAVIGDGGPGAGPRGVLFDALADAAPTAVAAIGDPLGWWRRQPGRRARSLALTSHVPVILVPDGESSGRGLSPKDPVRRRFTLPPTVYHLRLGPAVLVVLDGALGFSPDGPQLKFAAAVHAAHPDAAWRAILVTRGPVSSGPHGPHPDGRALLAVAERLGFQVVFSGQDRIYERLRAGATTVVVTGASGGQVDARARVADESQALLAAPHWIRADFEPRTATVRALGLEGALIDRVRLPVESDAGPSPVPWRPIWVALGLLVTGLIGVTISLLRPGRSPG